MKKRRLSIQAIFAKEHEPPVPAVPPPHSRNYKTLPRSFVAHYDAPSLGLPDSSDTFLLDDDPFADLSGGPWQQPPDPPKDPPPMPVLPARTVSTQRPAFRPRPSLPSLSTLAKMNVAVPKVRRGQVGAGLPAEPWDLDADALLVASPASISPPSATLSDGPVSPVISPQSRDFIAATPTPAESEILSTTPPETQSENPPQSTMIPIPPPILIPSPTTPPVSSFVSISPQSPIRVLPVSTPQSTPSTPVSATFLDLSSDSDEDNDTDPKPVTAVQKHEVTTSPETLGIPAVPLLDTQLKAAEVKTLTASPRIPPQSVASPSSPQPLSPPTLPPLGAHSQIVAPTTYPPLSPHPSLSVKPLPVLREIPSPEPPPLPPKDYHASSELLVHKLAADLDESVPDEIALDLGEDFGHVLGLNLGLGLDFGHSARGGEELEPAIGRKQSKRLSAQGQAASTSRASSSGGSTSRSRAGSAAVSRRPSRTILVSEVPSPLDTSMDSLDGYAPSSSRSRATSSASSSSSSRGVDETITRRRNFRKSSLVGDVLRFAPASPVQPSPMDDDLSTTAPQGSPAEDLDNMNYRASVFSMANNAGHESISPEPDYGLDYHSAGVSSPSARSPQGYSSPLSARSPERAYGYASPFSARSPERQFSSPYSTPSITTDARSPDSSWSGHDHTEFDFGWISEEPHSRRLPSSSTSESDYGEESVDDVRGRWDPHVRRAPPPPTPVSGGPGSVYSDEELAMADVGDSGRLAPAFVFPPRARIAESDSFEPGTSAGTIRASAQRPTPRSDSLWTEDEGGDDFSQSGGRVSAPSTSSSSTSESEDDNPSTDDLIISDTGSEDDVPLARRIPSALSAQRTIRRQVKEEREQRRREKEERRAVQIDEAGSRSRQTTLRPAAAGFAQLPPPVTAASQAYARLRTLTLPGSGLQSLAVDDLTKKLQNMQADRQRTLSINASGATDTSQLLSPGLPPRVSSSASPPLRHQTLPASRGLRSMRSFQRPKTADSARAPLPSDVQVRVGRSNTTHQPSNGREREPRALTVAVFPADFVPPLPSPSAASPNTLAKGPPPFGESLRSSGSPTALTRIFVGDMQHFNLVDIGPSTSAEEVLAVVEEQGSLKGWVGTGGWMVFEVAQDFGMERPIRSFELLADVQASWNKDKMVNMFIVKLTPLSPLLSRSNIPSSSPVFSGYVEWEYKRGKWTKRFMRLRESALWLTKRENGKDEICLCSVSSFDAYYLTRPHKAPKPFTFAVKSTDNLSLFENTADYVHIFSCDTNEGQKWAEMVLLARSYVLAHPQNAFSNPTPANENTDLGSPRVPKHKMSAPLLTSPSYSYSDIYVPLLRAS